MWTTCASGTSWNRVSKAACQAQVMVSSSDAGFSACRKWFCCERARKWLGRRRQLRSPSGDSALKFAFDVTAPVLWLPEEPDLYELRDACKAITEWTGGVAERDSVRSSPVGRTSCSMAGGWCSREWAGRYVEGARFHSDAPADGAGHADDQGLGGKFHPPSPLPTPPLRGGACR